VNFTPEQQQFILEQHIDAAQVFDATGMHIQKAKQQMKQN
jgi:hypothetical protein